MINSIIFLICDDFRWICKHLFYVYNFKISNSVSATSKNKKNMTAMNTPTYIQFIISP